MRSSEDFGCEAEGAGARRATMRATQHATVGCLMWLLSYPKPSSTTCVNRLRTFFRLYAYRPKRVACTASEASGHATARGVDRLSARVVAPPHSFA